MANKDKYISSLITSVYTRRVTWTVLMHTVQHSLCAKFDENL